MATVSQEMVFLSNSPSTIVCLPCSRKMQARDCFEYTVWKTDIDYP